MFYLFLLAISRFTSPLYQFIHARIAEGRNCRDDFYPANRPLRRLNTILRDKRAASSYFSVSVPDYPAIFDWIAANQQADFADNPRDERSLENISGLRSALAEKHQMASNFVHLWSEMNGGMI